MTIQAPHDTTSTVPLTSAVNRDRDVAEIGIRLLDDAYMAWLVAESEAEHAFREWLEPGARPRAAAYRGYRAAIDREDAAARDLERLREIVAPCIGLLAPGTTGD